MKDYRDVHADPIRHQTGDSVWVYTPRNLSAPHIPLPSDFTVDNSTLVSLDNTYDIFDHTLTQRITKLKVDINRLQPTSTTSVNDVFTYLAFTFTLINFFDVLILFRRTHQPRQPVQIPPIPLLTHGTTMQD